MSCDADEKRDRLFGGYPGRLLVACSFGWVGLSIGRFALAPMLPTIIEGLEITPFKAGLALSVLWGFYAMAQYPGGRLSDELSRKTLLVIGLSLLAVGFALFVVTIGYAIFVFAAVTVGIGAGIFSTPTKALITDLFSTQRGQALGVQTAASDMGGALAGSVAAAALAMAKWQVAFLPAFALVAVTLLMFHFWSREPYSVSRVDIDLVTTGRRLATNPQIRNLTLVYVLFSFTWQGTTSFLPALLQADKGFSTGLASAAFGVLFAIGIIVKPLAGTLGDHMTHPTVAAGALVLGVVGIIGIVAFSSIPLVVAMIIVFSAGFMAFPPVMQAFLMETFPDTSMGGDMGAIRTVYLGVGATGPTYVGLVAENFGYKLAFVGFILFLSMGLILLIVVVPTFRYNGTV